MSTLRAALVAAGLTLVAGTLGAEELQRDFNKTFEVEPGDRLHLDHGDGDVFIEPWDADRLEIDVVYDADYKRVGLGSRVDFNVEFRQNGSTVRVTGRESGFSGIGFFSHRQLDYRYTIKAPAYLVLDIEGEDGDVEIEGWTGEISLVTEDGDVDLFDIRSASTDLELEDGDLTIEGLSGELTIVSEDGSVRVEDCSVSGGRVNLEDGDVIFSRCEGSARFELDDGDLVLDRFRAASISIRSEDGDVELDLLPSEAMDVEVRTDDGDVVVDLSRESSIAFVIDTNDGAIRLDIPGASDVVKQRRRVSGRFGAGEGKLDIRTGDGRVILREGA